MILSAKDNIEKFIQNLSSDNFLSKKILSEFNTHRDSDVSSFFLLNDIDMMIMGENLSLSGIPDKDELEEIISFCNFLGIYGIECEGDSLTVNTKHVMNLLYNDTECRESYNDYEYVKDSNIYGFSKFSRANFTGTSFETVYSYFAKKVNRGKSHIYYINDNGKIVSGALASDYGDNIYITFVSTDKPNRKKGYASDIIKYIINDSNKRCMLMCENELMDFYSRLGFTKYKEIYLYMLREENI